MAEQSSRTSEQMIREAKEHLLRPSPPHPVSPDAVDLPRSEPNRPGSPAGSEGALPPQVHLPRAPRRSRPMQASPSPSPGGARSVPEFRRRRIVGAAVSALVFMSLGIAMFAGTQQTVDLDPIPATTVQIASTIAVETPPPPAAVAPATAAPSTPASSTTTQPPVPLQSTTGSLSVMGASNVTRVGIGGCVGAGDYAAVVEGAAVTVRDDGGADLAHGVLATGRRESLSGVTTGCTFPFSVELPEDRLAYVFEVGPISRSMSRSDLRSVDWYPEIRIDR